MRQSLITRTTAETYITLSIDLDGSGESEVDTGCGFLNHMLTLFARHGRFDLTVSCKGDLDVDAHHTTEDIGICLGRAFDEALGERRGICRYGSVILPMDETLVLAAADVSGRAHLSFDVPLPSPRVGDFDTELGREFFLAMTRTMGLTLHVKLLAGENTHHILEAVFKATARALRQAVRVDEAFAQEIPSTKGVL